MTPSLRTAVLTPAGRGAIAVVAVRGTGAEQIVLRRFTSAAGKRLTGLIPGRIHFGRFASGPHAAEELVVTARTADDVEIHCHGGPAAVAAVTQALAGDGAAAQTAEEFLAETEREIVRAEAREALSRATAERTARLLLRQYHGRLNQELSAVRDELQTDARAGLRRLRALEATWRVGEHLTQPWRVVLCGRPNAGKSSLLNALVGFERAIVFDQPGTTRDVVTATTALDGWPVEFADTAGLRTGADALEEAGIARAERQISAADLLLIVVDQTTGWNTADAALLAYPHLLVGNKSDLPRGGASPPEPLHAVSAKTGANIDGLRAAIVNCLVPEPLDDRAVLFTARQHGLVQEILRAFPPAE